MNIPALFFFVQLLAELLSSQGAITASIVETAMFVHLSDFNYDKIVQKKNEILAIINAARLLNQPFLREESSPGSIGLQA